tara:strand:- start:6475 stop:7809 length:1335 start_codon:yes stop_codon:yes gene_type:complete
MISTKKVAFHTLGCKLNFSETSTISRDFRNAGYQIVEFSNIADIYVINTCSVTENADKRFKTIVKKALSLNSKAFIIAIGCYAQLQPLKLAEVNGVDLVLGATEKFKIKDYINQLSKESPAKVHSCEIGEADSYQESFSIGDRTRAFLKVQDGCDYKCTYCTIPLARGVSRSDSLDNILKNANEISNRGIQEIVLTGVNIGDYGKGEFGSKKHKNTFLDLIKSLDVLEGIKRVRISSIEPNLLRNEIIEFVATSNSFVPHFHIPLQSGSDYILKRMKRRYLSALYLDRIKKIKELMPSACIGVDIIVGFPGESESNFLETYDFLVKLDISYMHVFTYSERLNTEASLMTNSVPLEIRNKRSKLLRGLSLKKRHAFYESQLGSNQTVLFEDKNKQGYIFGYTENYVKVKMPWNPAYVNNLKKVVLRSIDMDGVVRIELVEEPIEY